MGCRYCSSQWFLKKLGRCRQCMVLNLLLLIAGGTGCYLTTQSSAVYRVMAIGVTLAAVLLLCAHLIMAGYYALTAHQSLD